MITVGIDVSKHKLDNLWLKEVGARKVRSKVLSNTPSGHEQLIRWIEKVAKTSIEDIQFVMEATGIYHEALADALYEAGARVVVVNPARIKSHAQTLGSRNKTDRKDSFVIAHYGATLNPPSWQPEPPEIRELKALIARKQALEKDIQREENRLEKALIRQSSKVVCRSIESMIQVLTEQKDALQAEIDQRIDDDPDLKNDRRLLQSIPGVGPVLSALILVMMRSRSFKQATQCSAFLGLNPVVTESGTSLNKPPRLSKMGDAQVRAKLYMAAIVAIRHNPDIKQQYERLRANGKSSKSAIGAAMRKLVQICFGVLKHQTKYQPQCVS